jgi:hypothetical protein
MFSTNGGVFCEVDVMLCFGTFAQGGTDVIPAGGAYIVDVR